MNVEAIKTEAEYQSALQEIEGLMAAEFDKPEGERLDLMVTLVEAYERQHCSADLAPSQVSGNFG